MRLSGCIKIKHKQAYLTGKTKDIVICSILKNVQDDSGVFKSTTIGLKGEILFFFKGNIYFDLIDSWLWSSWHIKMLVTAFKMVDAYPK